MAISSAFKQQCPSCEALVPVKDRSLIGKKIDCPKCKYRFVVEAPADEEAPVTNGAKKADGPPAKVKKSAAAPAVARNTAPPAKAGVKKAPLKPPAEEEEEDLDALDDEDEEEAPARTNGKTAAKGKPAATPAPTDEDEEETEEPSDKAKKGAGKGGKKKKKKAAAAEGDDRPVKGLAALMQNKKLMLGLGLGAVGLVALVICVIMMKGSGSPAKKGGTAPTPPPIAQGSDKDKEKTPEPKKDEAPAQVGLDTGPTDVAGDALTNLLPGASEHVFRLNLKNLLDTPAGKLVFQTPGGLDDAELSKRLGFSAQAIDTLLRAESYSFNWAYNVIHSTRTLEEPALVAALGLEPAAGSPINNQKFYKATRNLAFLTQFARLSVSGQTGRGVRASAEAQRPLLVRLHDPHTLIVGDAVPVMELVREGQFKFQSEAPAPAPQPQSGPPSGPSPPKGPGGSMPPGFQPPPGFKMPTPPGGTPGQPPTGSPPGQPPSGFKPPAGFKPPTPGASLGQPPVAPAGVPAPKLTRVRLALAEEGNTEQFQIGAQPPPLPGANPGQQPPPGFQPPGGAGPFPKPPGGISGQPPGIPKMPPSGVPAPGPAAPPPTVGFRTTWMTIKPSLKAMLDRMEDVSKGTRVLFSSATDMEAARTAGANPTGDRLLRRLGRVWNVTTALAEDRAAHVRVHGAALHQKNLRLSFHNRLECTAEADAQNVRHDLQEKVGPEVARFFDKGFAHKVEVDLETPVAEQPKQTGPGMPGFPFPGGMPPGMKPPQPGNGSITGGPNPFPGGSSPPPGGSSPPPGGSFPGGGGSGPPPGAFSGMPGFPGGKPGFPGMPGFPGGPGKDTTKTAPPEDEANSSRIRVQQTGTEVNFALDLVLQGPNDETNLQNAIALLSVAFRGELAAAAGLDPRFVLAHAGRLLGERGLSNKVPPGQYPYGAFKRTGTMYSAREPDHRISWMAGLLPYLGQEAIYDRIHWNDSWDEPANWLAARVVVPQFLDPNYPVRSRKVAYPGLPVDVGATHFVGIAGVGIDAADYDPDDPANQGKLGILGYDRSLALKRVEAGHGLANTILLVEVRPDGPAGVTPWMAGGGSTLRGVPEKNSVRPFVAEHGDKRGKGTFALMADGSVRFVSEKISDEVFKAMCTVEGPRPERFDVNNDAPLVVAPKVEAEPEPVKEAPKGPPADVVKPAPVETKPTPPAAAPLSARDQAILTNQLKMIGLAYHNYLDTTQRPPAKWQDLEPFYEKDAQVTAALKDGRLVVIYNLNLRKLTAGTSNTVMGYERGVPSRGGPVLMADGSVRTMTAPEFQKVAGGAAAPRPTTAPGPAGQAAGKVPPGWQQVTSKEGGFSALMPPQPKTQQRATAGGGTMTTILAGGATSVFGVMFQDLPPGSEKVDPNVVFALGLKGGLATMPGGKVQSEKSIALGRSPGKEWVIQAAGKGTLVLRSYLVNRRNFTLMAGGDTLTPASPEVQAFLNSFQLLSQ